MPGYVYHFLMRRSAEGLVAACGRQFRASNPMVISNLARVNCRNCRKAMRVGVSR